ncbi:Dihydrofolate reductase [Neolecta irregularis DAH-3]|uniref:Dihydrofolate reductase n=1 Tax=Neolecta irregularis (strain DAH-3) TaxID=1198029 RepID=A0A1U7LM41_NEOID|nr:Dihydrofolate reductase [Neolecta irregularis DAH-3]|eukprot:OLL23581.1 Dihydrofolate reductase [Neolecta irregularis DAH-3]
MPGLPLTLIVAATPTLGIGRNCALPWRLKEEMAYFARVTTSAPNDKVNAVIMGRKCWDSIPRTFRPLKDRVNVIISRNPALDIGNREGTHLAGCLDDAIRMLQVRHSRSPLHHIFIIGGAQIYKKAMEHPDTKYILYTRIQKEFDCDCFFPVDFTKDDRWKQQPRAKLQEFINAEVLDLDHSRKDPSVTWEYTLWAKTD